MQVIVPVVSAVSFLALFFVLGTIAFRSSRLGRIQIFIALGLYTSQVTLYLIAVRGSEFAIESIFYALYDCAKIFVFDFGYPELVNSLFIENAVFPAMMSVVAVAGGLFTVLTVISVFLNAFFGKIRCALFTGKEVSVFFGDDGNSLALAKSVRAKNKRAFIIVLGAGENKEACIKEGFVYFSFPDDEGFLDRRVFARRAVSLFFVSPDAAQNTAAAYRMLKETKAEVFHKSKFAFYIGTPEASAKALFDKAAVRGVGVKIFDENALMAEKAMVEGLYDAVEFLPATASALKPFQFFISGANAVGRAFFDELSVVGQIAPHRTKAIVNDKDISAFEGAVLSDCPEIGDCLDLQFLSLTPGSSAFYETIRDNLETLSYIVLCHEDETANLEAGMRIAQLYGRAEKKIPPVLVYCKDENRYRYFADMAGAESVRLFGRTVEIYSENIIVAGVMDAAAKTLNDFYEENKLQSEAAKGKQYVKKTWEELEIFTQNSNRKAIAGFRLTMRLLGLNTPEEKKNYLSDSEKFNEFVKTRLRKLAETEHLRWNALHYINGWVKLPLSQALQTGVKKNVVTKRHVCLVPFKELSVLDEKLNETYIVYDEENITRMPKIYARHPEIF